MAPTGWRRQWHYAEPLRAGTRKFALQAGQRQSGLRVSTRDQGIAGSLQIRGYSLKESRFIPARKTPIDGKSLERKLGGKFHFSRRGRIKDRIDFFARRRRYTAERGIARGTLAKSNQRFS